MSDHDLPELRVPSFWQLQLSGWLLYFLLNAVSSISYRHRPDYLAFRGAFMLSGFLCSFLIYALCHSLWKHRASMVRIVVACLAVSYPLGIMCSASAFWCAIHLGDKPVPLRWGDVVSAAPSGAFVLAAWGAFYFGIKYYFALEEKHRQLMASQSLAKEAQLRALRYELGPHFLFNTLNAISTLVLDSQPLVATQMISKLGNLLRSTLDTADLHHVSFADEISVTDKYLAIEELRFGERLKVHLDLDPAVMQTRVPHLILQPLVENAVRHGIAQRPQGGSITIRAGVRGQNLAVEIENEICESAYSRTTQPGRNGVGLTNVRKRLEQMYGSDGILCADTNSRGNYEVSILLPLNNHTLTA
jgi:two-component sensor histidine kinase